MAQHNQSGSFNESAANHDPDEEIRMHAAEDAARQARETGERTREIGRSFEGQARAEGR
jgi:hypothetical protein